ncbi:MAG TPA: DUF4832 domain-containing protein [Pirellulales bacterium]|nr:DUF4832 domain-containing protein [Pirellulales bacterium]
MWKLLPMLCFAGAACASPLVRHARAAEKVVRPGVAEGALDNPLKGWCPYTDAGDIQFPYSMVFFPVAWKELEPREGQYAFDKWEKEAWSAEKARGKHVVFRIYADMPGRPTGMPQWLIDKGVRLTAYADHGGGQSPDYDHPKMASAMEKLIAALGRRYDDHPRVAFIQLGLLGFWGEWHTYPRNELFASPATQKRVIDAYHKAFSKKRLMARNPADYAGKQIWLGFHDDMLPEDTDGPEGWKFLPRLRSSGRTENWKRAAFGGEMVFNGNQRWLGADFAHMLKMVEDAHFSWVGPYCPALEPAPTQQFTQRAARLVRLMGYQFSLSEIRYDAEPVVGGDLKIAIQGENQGVAPFYYPWALEFALLDRAGKPVARLAAQWDVRKWLPGRFSESAVLGPLPSVAAPGDYQLAMGIIDPWTKRPSIQLANDLKRQDGWTILSTIKIVAR